MVAQTFTVKVSLDFPIEAATEEEAQERALELLNNVGTLYGPDGGESPDWLGDQTNGDAQVTGN